MPVTDQTPVDSSTGNGVTTVFPYTFKILAEADILVTVDGVTKTLTTDYSVSGVGNDAGGNVTFVAAPANGTTVVRTRDMGYERTTDYQDNGDLPASTLDDDIDRTVMLVQQLRAALLRSVKLPVGTTVEQVLTESAAARADKIMGFDSSGNIVVKAAVDIDVTPVSVFMASVLDDTTWQEALNTLGFKKGADIASAATVDLGTATGNTVDVTHSTGTTAITSLGGASLQAGTEIETRFVITGGTLTLTHHATNLYLAGGANITLANGDVIRWRKMHSSNAEWKMVGGVKADGTAWVVGASGAQIQPISASVGSNALTISASALTLDFRSTTLGSGTVSTVSGTPSNLVISSGSTLGTVNAVQSRIAVLAINNAGTIELAAVNIAGGNNLDETTLISTTAEGGAGAADSVNVIYSTTARSNVAFRVIGYIESTQATAGTWATAPSTIQGAGGNAATAMSSLGYGQTWQNVAGSRSLGTTYYNTTGRPILVNVSIQPSTTSTAQATVGGVLMYGNTSASGSNQLIGFVVPSGVSYVVNSNTGSPTIGTWAELR